MSGCSLCERDCRALPVCTACWEEAHAKFQSLEATALQRLEVAREYFEKGKRFEVLGQRALDDAARKSLPLCIAAFVLGVCVTLCLLASG